MLDRILIVDDDPSVLSALQRTLRQPKREIVTDMSAEEALYRLQKQKFKVIISDERMARMLGSEFLSQVRSLYPQIVRILLTGHATLEAALRAVNEGEVYRILTKPWDDHNLRQTVSSAVNKYDLEQDTIRLLQELLASPITATRLKTSFPGINLKNRDSRGAIVLPNLNDEELNQLRQECLLLCSEA
jgi:DNA-binding NtrC family response regulator